MPKGTDFKSTQVTKLLFLGQSGSGKSGALASLLAAGYNVRVVDFDNGIETLVNILTDAKSPYPKDSISRLDYFTLTDEYHELNGKPVCKSAKAWAKMVSLLGNWTDGDTKYGKITTWTNKDVLVLDTLTRLSTAAMNFNLQLNGLLGKPRTQNEARRDIWAAQSLIESLLQMLYDSSVHCNVIVNSHITYIDDEGQGPAMPDSEGRMTRLQHGFPSSLGKALGPRIPTYFNTTLLAKVDATGRRRIHTQSTDLVNLKTSAPFRMPPTFPLETGLADYFKLVQA